MHTSKTVSAAFLLAFAACHQVFGCELCAIYSANHGMGAADRGWFTGAAEQFTTFGSMQLGGTEVANPAGQRIESSTTQFVLGYSFNDHFSLQANIPYIHRSFRRPGANGIEEGSESGLGDAILVGKLALWRKDTGDGIFTGSLLGGVKFPTGSTARLRQETQALNAAVSSTGGIHGGTGTTGTVAATGIHGYDLTLGSGSFDTRVGASIYYSHKRAFFSAAFQYAICSEGDYGYRFSNDLTWDGGPGYYLLTGPSQTLALEAAISGEHKDADTYKDQPVDSTGITAVYVGPKLTYTWKDRLTAHFGVDFPVSIENRGLQAVPGARVRAGFTWMFGPSSAPAAAKPPSSKAVTMDGNSPPIWTPAPETRFYAGVEYLQWWVKDAPLSVPLVSTGTVASTHHGFLNYPDTTILYGSPFSPSQGGNDTQRFQGFSGTRVKLGYALGSERRFAVEASGFALEQRSAGFGITSDKDGLPVINIPVFNTISYTPGGRPGGLPPAEDGLPASLPADPHRVDGNVGVFQGSVTARNTLQLWGTEAVGVISLYRSPSWEVSGLLGARYLDLDETFSLDYSSVGVTGRYVGMSGGANDTFRTQNQFIGGVLGLRGSYTTGRVSVDMTGRVALGATHQTETVTGGFYSIGQSGPYVTGPAGIFAQPANEGRTSRDRFSVVPDVQIKIGYALTPRIRATIGYDFMYFSGVMRPTDQMSHYIPKGQTFQQGGKNVSTTSPARLSDSSDFFAHGLCLGLEVRF